MYVKNAIKTEKKKKPTDESILSNTIYVYVLVLLHYEI